jgi:hypothetical protein
MTRHNNASEMAKTHAEWYLALNTMTPGSDIGWTVLSAHRTAGAALKACRSVQPRERGSYLPTAVRVSAAYHRRGDIVSVSGGER